jgi:hypothetical protein
MGKSLAQAPSVPSGIPCLVAALLLLVVAEDTPCYGGWQRQQQKAV